MRGKATLRHLIAGLRERLPLLAERYGVQSLWVFGSYVRQDQRSVSDLDVLVAFREPPDLLQFVELENYLTEALGVRVDLVMRDALKPGIGERILREMVPV